jgi:hypothetical protein
VLASGAAPRGQRGPGASGGQKPSSILPPEPDRIIGIGAGHPHGRSNHAATIDFSSPSGDKKSIANVLGAEKRRQ